MDLTKPNAQKLYLTRARLWANVFWSSSDSFKGLNTSPDDVTKKATRQADAAMAAFNNRFGKSNGKAGPEPQPGSV